MEDDNESYSDIRGFPMYPEETKKNVNSPQPDMENERKNVIVLKRSRYENTPSIRSEKSESSKIKGKSTDHKK